jgi:FixJ family two-component response regulator
MLIPVIFISGYAGPQVEEAVKTSGAIAFLRKPVNDQDLLDALQSSKQQNLNCKNNCT